MKGFLIDRLVGNLKFFMIPILLTLSIKSRFFKKFLRESTKDKIQKFDIVAKNYLTKFEIGQVNAYLDIVGRGCDRRS